MQFVVLAAAVQAGCGVGRRAPLTNSGVKKTALIIGQIHTGTRILHRNPVLCRWKDAAKGQCHCTRGLGIRQPLGTTERPRHGNPLAVLAPLEPPCSPVGANGSWPSEPEEELFGSGSWQWWLEARQNSRAGEQSARDLCYHWGAFGGSKTSCGVKHARQSFMSSAVELEVQMRRSPRLKMEDGCGNFMFSSHMSLNFPAPLSNSVSCFGICVCFTLSRRALVLERQQPVPLRAKAIMS